MWKKNDEIRLKNRGYKNIVVGRDKKKKHKRKERKKERHKEEIKKRQNN